MNADVKVLTPVVMNISAFWNITLCSPLEVNLLLGGTCRLRLQGRPKRLLTISVLDCVISQKMGLYLGT
jgi:hypothetical protein